MVTLDNFGIFLAGHIVPITSGSSRILTDVVGLTHTVRLIGNSSNKVWNDTGFGSLGDFIQIGKGSTPATRQDFKIEDPFTTAPESSRFVCIPAGYNSGLGKITISGTLGSTGGTGTITEVTKEQAMINTSNPTVLKNFCFFRDNISPVNFIIGQSVFVSYEVLI